MMMLFAIETGGEWGTVLEFVTRSTLMLALAWILAACLRRGSAANRHLLWLTASVAVITMPLVQIVVPDWPVLPASFRVLTSPAKIEFDTAANPVESLSTIHSSAVTDTPSVSAPPSDRFPLQNVAEDPVTASLDVSISATGWPSVLTIVWGLGVLTFSLPLILGSIRVWMMRRTDQVIPQALIEEVHELAKSIRVSRRVNLLLSDACVVPMTWGVWEPTILLPLDVMTWSEERRRIVFLHELAHISRFDCLTQVMGQIARALYWFNPLAWLALRQLRVEQESACDDVVLNFGTNAADYASELLTVTAHLPRESWDAAVTLAMSRTKRIERRLHAILNSKSERRPLTPGSILATVGLMSLATTCIAIVGLRAADAAPAGVAAIQDEPGTKEMPPETSKVSPDTPPDKIKTEVPVPEQQGDVPKATKPIVELGFENGDFETDKVFHGIPPAAIPEKQCANAQFVRLSLEQEGHNSPHSASITIDPAHPSDPVSYSWLAKLRGWKPEQALEISAWVKTSEVKTSPGLSVHCWGKQMSLLAIASTPEKSNVTGTTDWVRLSTLVFVPKETDQIQVRAFLTMPDNGGAKVWFDDFQAVETDAAAAKLTMRHLSLIERAPRNLEMLGSLWTPGRQSAWSAEIDAGTFRCQIRPSYLTSKNPPATATAANLVSRIWYQSITETNGGSRYAVPRRSIHMEKRDPDNGANSNP